MPFPIAAAIVAALIALPGAVGAESVFKCTVNGQTTYQAAPCVGKGGQVAIAPGPSEQQVRDAQQRAAAEKSQALSSSPLTQPSHRNQVARPQYDCGKLNQQRAQAYGRRNAILHTGRNANIDNPSGMSQAQQDIARVESRMSTAGCAAQ